MLREAVAVVREWLLRLLGAFWRRPTDGDLRQELSLHLELAEADLRRLGHTAEEAARLARIRHGQSDNALEQLRGQRGIPWFGAFTLDVKLGCRMLRKQLGLTLIGGLAVAIAIGIVTCVFMYFDVTVWTDTVPLDEGGRVVAIQIWDPEKARRSETGLQDFRRWREQLQSLEHVGAFRTVERDLIRSDAEDERVQVAEMSAAGFSVARVSPVLGRTLLPEDERAGAAPVIVIGYDEWQNRFDGDPAVLGRTLRLDDGFYAIVGVMPGDFGFPINHRFWIPLQADADGELPAPPAGAVFGRLAPGVTLETAQAELASIGLLPPDVQTQRSEPLRPTALPYIHNFIDDESPESLAHRGWTASLVIFFVSFLLVPPCVNIAMLVYAKTVTRQEEIAVRTALGASRSRIVAQLFIETLVLTTLAAAVALVGVHVVARYMENLLVARIERLPFWIDLGLTPEMLLFVAGLAVAGAVIIGLVPALKMTARFARPGQSALDRRNRARLGPMWTLLVVAQVAFSFAVLPSASELAWGVLGPHVLGPGFAAGEYLTAYLSMGKSGLDIAEDTPELRARFDGARNRLVRQIEADPRVRGPVTTSAAMPGEGPWQRVEIEAGGSRALSENREIPVGTVRARSIGVDDRYFETFDVPMLAGRNFDGSEFTGSSRSVIVDATFARNAFDGANPLGRRIRDLLPPDASEDPESTPWHEIVGIAADRPSHPYAGSVFYPADTAALYPASIGFRVGPDAASLREQLPRMATAVDPLLQVDLVRSLAEIYDEQALGDYIGGFAVITCSLAVLLLSAAGAYALMSFTVNQRRREIGIRLALGARPRGLLAGIFRRALRQMAVGATAGLLIALLVQHYLPADRIGGWEVPGVLPSAVILMVLTGLVAAFGPARRTLEIDPTEALREGG